MAEESPEKIHKMNAALHIQILGTVQGVGFRPFVYGLAKEMGITGYVLNSAQGVFIEGEASPECLEKFLVRLEREKPEIASIHSLQYSWHQPKSPLSFEIRKSRQEGKKTAFILPDIATCPDCLKELFNTDDRRYRYPFINCTNCGPRFSIIESLPYDRPKTTMKGFAMCPDCANEYRDPGNRRFHAQPNACPVCGPHLLLTNQQGNVEATHDDALKQAAEAIKKGKILAFKGVGGFQLMADSRSERAVELLRSRKHRHEKPFAVMYPSLEMVKRDCRISKPEERLLQSIAAPIVLLEKKETIGMTLAGNVAPGNPWLGVMLPYSPLHHLLMKELNFPIVATSGNLSDEPICIHNQEALQRLSGIADLFLMHNRPIMRQVDDSVVRLVAGKEQVLRRARGYAPLPVHIKEKSLPLLAVGAHLKNSVALLSDNEVFISQHIGDLESAEAYAGFRKVIEDFQRLYEIKPRAVACDLHPEYLSTKYAEALGIPLLKVQHHYAHMLACMADNSIEGPVLGISWDGTGLGMDNTIWGGEFLLSTEKSFQRVAHLRTFRLPGGEAAIKNPARTAIGLLYEIFGTETFEKEGLIPIQNFNRTELRLFQQMLTKGLNSPITSSAGRLFDAVAALIGLKQKVSFEGQAAMELEFAIEKNVSDRYAFQVQKAKTSILNWEPMVLEIIDDLNQKIEPGIISAKFHNTLVEMIIAIAKQVGEAKVVLTGGCFQNKYLCERAIDRLTAEGFQPYWHQKIPPNDGGIALGQLMALQKAQGKFEV